MGEVLERMGAYAAWRWLFAAHAALGEARDDLDALNVFPVPDGDTGTNMFLTLDGAMEALLAKGTVHIGSPLSGALTALAMESLLAARGNSGVILSQLLRGVAEVAGEHPEIDSLGLDGAGLARAMDLARQRARAAVTAPVEGTILTVADAAADGALAAAAQGRSLAEVSGALHAAAREALADTPRRLPMLAAAGVVDAGGAGLYLAYCTLHETLSGAPVPRDLPGRPRSLIGGNRATIPATPPRPSASDLVGAHPEPWETYEVMYVVGGVPDAGRDQLRAVLGALGDSVMVAGDDALTTVHVHTAEAGAAVEAAFPFGLPERLRITWLGGSPASAGGGPPHGLLRPVPSAATLAAGAGGRCAVLACAPGPRLAQVMADAGAWVVSSSPGRRATTGDLLAARREIAGDGVILLANHDDTVMAAQLAGRLAGAEGLPTVVVPTRAAVAGLAALAVFEPSADLGVNAAQMTDAAQSCRAGSLVTAARSAVTEAGACRPGDLVAYVDRRAVAVGGDPDALADGLLAELLDASSELVTIVAGEDHPDGSGAGLARRLGQRLRAARPDLEVALVAGDPGRYSLLVGVE
ncbi:MAG: DAK2 domain-containing protein [Austwickia sp.]|nr:MAG: DAK2 domain-containing protein [Austwickia sp.]